MHVKWDSHFSALVMLLIGIASLVAILNWIDRKK